jgi:hypothetical protein
MWPHLLAGQPYPEKSRKNSSAAGFGPDSKIEDRRARTYKKRNNLFVAGSHSHKMFLLSENLWERQLVAIC